MCTGLLTDLMKVHSVVGRHRRCDHPYVARQRISEVLLQLCEARLLKTQDVASGQGHEVDGALSEGFLGQGLMPVVVEVIELLLVDVILQQRR